MSAEQYIEELRQEKGVLDPNDFQHAIRLLDTEINNVRANNNEGYEESAPPKKMRYEEEIVKLSEKIMLPIEDYPRFNFVGKLLGPKGSTMKAIQGISKTKISILGRGSTRNKEKEEELCQSDDPKNEHFKEALHIIIHVKAPRSEAHERLANCLEEINKCMDMENDGMRQEHNEDKRVLTNGFDLRRQGGEGVCLPPSGLNGPIIRVGIPPPGAIILNGLPPAGADGGTRTGSRGRGNGRGRGRGDRHTPRGGQRTY